MVYGLGFRLRFEVQGSGSGLWQGLEGSGFVGFGVAVEGLAFGRVWGSGFGFRVWGWGGRALPAPGPERSQVQNPATTEP